MNSNQCFTYTYHFDFRLKNTNLTFLLNYIFLFDAVFY